MLDNGWFVEALWVLNFFHTLCSTLSEQLKCTIRPIGSILVGAIVLHQSIPEDMEVKVAPHLLIFIIPELNFIGHSFKLRS